MRFGREVDVRWHDRALAVLRTEKTACAMACGQVARDGESMWDFHAFPRKRGSKPPRSTQADRQIVFLSRRK